MSGRAAVSVDFFADVSCPWCYVGWAALKQAALTRRDRVAVSVTWRTFMLSPDTPLDGVDRAGYLSKRFSPAQLEAAHKALQAAADAAGAPLNIDAAKRIPNTVDAHRVVHWAAQQGVAGGVIDAIFHAYFVDVLDIGSMDVLVASAESAGLDPVETSTRLKTEEDRSLVLGFHAAAQQMGLSGVPVAVFNRARAVMGGQSPEAYGAAIDASV